jgi:hypothetical protein
MGTSDSREAAGDGVRRRGVTSASEFRSGGGGRSDERCLNAFASVRVLLGLMVALPGSLIGCQGLGTQYVTPRTLAPGEASHTVILESYPNLSSGCSDDYCQASAMLLPGYALRVGLARRLDWGLRLAIVGLITDLKLQFMDRERIGMAAAISGGIAVTNEKEDAYKVVQAGLRIIFGVDLGDRTTLVPSAQIAYLGALSSISGDEHALVLGMGLGIEIPTSPRFSLYPAVSFFAAVTGSQLDLGQGSSENFMFLSIGLGLTWGPLDENFDPG